MQAAFQLDSLTLVVVSTAVTLVLSLLAVFFWRTRRTCPGFGAWTVGNAAASACLVLFSVRAFLPIWAAVVLANLLSIEAAILFLRGARELKGRAKQPWAAYAIGAGTMLGLIYFQYVIENRNTRIVLSSLCLGILGLWTSGTFFSEMSVGSRLSSVFTGTVFAATGLADLIRAGYHFGWPTNAELFADSPFNTAYFVGLAMAVVGWSFGFFLLNNDWLMAELLEAHGRTAAINRDLEKAVGRANDLAETATSADAAKSQFLAHMSHELRTPLNGVIGLLGVVLDEPLNEGSRPDLETVHQSAGFLLDIINDVLDLSKMESGELTIVKAPFDLRGTLDSIVELFRFQANANATNLHISSLGGLPRWFQGDEMRVRQILSNYVSNAIKFTKGGDVRIGVSSHGSMLRLWVRDTGIGIAESASKRLFSKYVQANGNIAKSYGGTGLGLAICKSLAELMSGCVGFDSEEGRGSTFWVDLPLEPLEHIIDHGAGVRVYSNS